jgi:DNA-binding GntR family transcriptional regulator
MVIVDNRPMPRKEIAVNSEPSHLQPVEALNLRAQIEKELRKAILRGVFKPGERLVESVIASQMGVSRAPVREVLSALEREGLVVNIPRRGNFVVDFEAKDIEEIYSLRLMLEVGALRRAVTRFTEKDIESLQHILDCMGEAVLKGDDPMLEVELDLSFHEYIYQLADHSRMLNIWNGIRMQTQLLIGLTSQTEYAYPTQPKEFHQLILDAFQNKKLDIAEAHLTEHMMDAQQRALHALAQMKRTETREDQPFELEEAAFS